MLDSHHPQHTHNHQDIVVVEQNQIGCDLIIGDIHGNKDAIERVFAALDENDRLFSVGDLVDKGKDSLATIEVVSNFKKQKPNRLYIVRGNHEDLCLRTIHSLEEYTFDKIFDKKNYITSSKNISKSVQKHIDSYCAIQHHIENGGKWLQDLFNQEVSEHKILLAHGEVSYSDDSKIKMIKEFMSSLPYIIYVRGDKPFNVVHADLPFNDKELKKKIVNKDFKITDEQKKYATWAREKDCNIRIETKNKSAYPIITYVGHSIIAEGDIPCIRYKTNTVNLDVCAYYYDISLVANHTKANSFYCGNNKEKENDEVFIKINAELNLHLHAQKQLNEFLLAAKSCDNIHDFDKVVNQWHKKIKCKGADGKKRFFSANELALFANEQGLQPCIKTNVNSHNGHGHTFSTVDLFRRFQNNLLMPSKQTRSVPRAKIINPINISQPAETIQLKNQKESPLGETGTQDIAADITHYKKPIIRV